MSLPVIVGIAVGLAMDAFAVALASSVSLGTVSRRQLFRLSFHFGLFQGFMPVFGWWVGSAIARYIDAWDHWVAFGLLVFVGGKALYEAVAHRDEGASISSAPPKDPTRGWNLVLLSVATSIDALAVGLSFAMLNITIWYPCAIIGIVTAGITAVGMLLGSRVGARFGHWVEVFGGVILIGIGLKILFEHLGG